MPWCPKCKNEYKEGITVCSDCGCTLIEELGNEIIAYYGTEEEVDSLLDYLESKGFDFAYKIYDNKNAVYELMMQESMIDSVRDTMKEYINKLKENASLTPDYSNFYEESEDDTPTVLKRYKKPSERAVEYKSGFQTMVLVGVVGLVALVLIDLGIIPIYFSKESNILINIVMGGMFLVFIAVGINSYKTYRKLLLQSSSDDELENSIIKWFNEAITVHDITVGENTKDNEEVLFFNRFKKIKRYINDQFEDLDPAFVEYVADKLYSDMFK